MLGKENKKLSCHHGIFAGIIILLFSLILIVLVFKAGLMIGHMKSSFYHCNYSKDFSSHYDYKIKKVIAEQYEKKAEAMDMTIEEYKEYLAEQKKVKYEDFEVKAEAMGMTIEEYKEYLAEQK